MRTDGFIRQIAVFRNRRTKDYRPFEVILADENPEGEIPRWEEVEWIKIYPNYTEVIVKDLDRPIYYKLPDGTRRKVIYPRKSRGLATKVRSNE